MAVITKRTCDEHDYPGGARLAGHNQLYVVPVRPAALDARLGTDSPAGSGVQPLGIVRMISLLSSLGGVPAEVAICLATGNTAKMRKLGCGIIAPGREASFVLMDKAQNSAGKNLLDSIQKGDLPGIGMVIIDGAVSAHRSRNTPPATAVPEVLT